MEITNKKPEWSKDPQPMDFKLINEPIEKIYREIYDRLNREPRTTKNFYLILKYLLLNSFRTYKAIRKLVANDPRYPTQAHILCRSLIDTLFTIIALTENPDENTKKYEKAG
ncbi:MAG: DUF5677 domain-containing protein, partial [Planctomycetota bacterium]